MQRVKELLIVGKKSVFVLWSGGLDSTYMIQQYLALGHTVRAGYVEILNNTEKTVRELKAIECMTPLFKGDFSYVGVVGKYSIETPENYVFNQVTNLFIALHSVQRCDMIAIGYCMNDDILGWLGDVKKAYLAFKPLVNHLPKLTFPLLKTSKVESMGNLAPELSHHITWCEAEAVISPDTCECVPCRRMRNTFPYKNKLTSTQDQPIIVT